MQIIVNIKNIAEVISGYTFRDSIKEDRESELYVLQAKNIKDDILINEDSLIQTKCYTSHTNAFAQDGDVVISTRGTFRTAVLRSTKRIIASSSVYLLRLKGDGLIMPEFLTIYMNSAFGQKDISQVVTGAAIKLILRNDLESINIPVLPRTQQEKMVALYKNIKQQEDLLKRRNELHKNIMNAAFHKLIRS